MSFPNARCAPVAFRSPFTRLCMQPEAYDESLDNVGLRHWFERVALMRQMTNLVHWIALPPSNMGWLSNTRCVIPEDQYDDNHLGQSYASPFNGCFAASEVVSPPLPMLQQSQTFLFLISRFRTIGSASDMSGLLSDNLAPSMVDINCAITSRLTKPR